MPLPLIVVGAAVKFGADMVQSAKAKKQAKIKQEAYDDKQKKLEALIAGRQEIPDMTKFIKDESENITNQYENIGVATQAAEMQAEQEDISLANTLDTIRETGSGAGGATALAQAAMKGKQAVSASIEGQEAKNQQLKAQGASEQQRLVMQEKQRVQGAMANAEKFRFGQQELREGQAMDRMQALSDQDRADQIEQQGIAAESASDAFGALSDVTTGIYNANNPVPGDTSGTT